MPIMIFSPVSNFGDQSLLLLTQLKTVVERTLGLETTLRNKQLHFIFFFKSTENNGVKYFSIWSYSETNSVQNQHLYYNLSCMSVRPFVCPSVTDK